VAGEGRGDVRGGEGEPGIRMRGDRVRRGYPRVSGPTGSSLRMVSHPRFSGSVLGLVLGSVSGLVFHPHIQWISEINHLELKLMFYYMLIITYLLRLLNLFKIDS
jgi:hypothetical protein